MHGNKRSNALARATFSCSVTPVTQIHSAPFSSSSFSAGFWISKWSIGKRKCYTASHFFGYSLIDDGPLIMPEYCSGDSSRLTILNISFTIGVVGVVCEIDRMIRRYYSPIQLLPDWKSLLRRNTPLYAVLAFEPNTDFGNIEVETWPTIILNA